MTIKKRLEIANKFGGLCAYTGKPLDNTWQIDHVEPHMYAKMYGRNPNQEENLFPTLGIINHYKRCQNLESFRIYMNTFHLRLKKLPKKTIVERTKKRIEYMNQIANAFGISVDKPFSGTFYFETLFSSEKI